MAEPTPETVGNDSAAPRAAADETVASSDAAENQAPAESSAEAAPANGAAPNLSKLPKFTRSLYKVRVPVSVNLASQKLAVQDIVELVPGSIIKFDKSCDDLLELVVGDQPIAVGEAVKVGDKFGLRVRNMILPPEQFVAIKTTVS